VEILHATIADSITHRGGEAELEAELGDGSGGNGTTTAVEDDSQYRLTAD
jgi:hypothetical protein